MKPPQECPAAPKPAEGDVPIPCAMGPMRTGGERIPVIVQCSRCGHVDPDQLDRTAERVHTEMMGDTAQRIAMATTVTPFVFVVQTGHTLTFEEGAAQALAAASEMGRESHLDAGRAQEIWKQLCLLHYEEMRRHGWQG